MQSGDTTTFRTNPPASSLPSMALINFTTSHGEYFRTHREAEVIAISSLGHSGNGLAV